jgi:DNA-binding GntR family transcriptional regulator
MIAGAQPGRVASQREVARRLGVSHTALQKAQRTGRIA